MGEAKRQNTFETVMNKDEFAELCELIPEGVHWGDLLTPQMASDFVQNGLAVNIARYAQLVQAVEWILDDGHMNTEHLARLRAAYLAVIAG